MPSYVPPKRATEFIFTVGLVSQASRPQLQDNPTIVAGDVSVVTDNGTETALDTLPVVTPVASTFVKVTVSVAEMTGDNITIFFRDAAGAEWDDLMINIQTVLTQIDGLLRPITPGNEDVDVAADGLVGADIQTWLDVIPNILVSGRVDATLDEVLTLPAQGAPPLTAKLAEMVAWNYKTFRNKKTQNATRWALFDDDGLVIDSKATISDAAGTATKEEIESGP